MIGIDLIGPLKLTPQGNRFIVTCTNYMSKWPEAEALPTKSAGVAHFLNLQADLRHYNYVSFTFTCIYSNEQVMFFWTGLQIQKC